MIKYAQVYVPVPLDCEFTYSFDTDEMDIFPGVRVYVDFNRRKTHAYVVSVSDSSPQTGFEIKKVSEVIDKEAVFSESDVKLALWMEKFYFSHRGIALDTIVPGWKKDSGSTGLDFEAGLERPDVELTSEQRSAISRILTEDKQLFYLFGVTGSGKTEVFLNCAQNVIESGGQVIYLVPEITLTHQLAIQVLKRFNNNVAIIHSGITPKKKSAQYKKIRNGEVGLVIGARSAVFAPCKNLKMIIIDEEHENSYKSGNDPRYHARQVAQKRIQDCGGKLVMGSATPSLEAWNMMKDSSKMVRLDLTQRVGGGSMPIVHIADTSFQKGMFSPQLLKMMNETLVMKKQVILFLNRRGFSYYFHCRSCGYELKCPHCDVAMTYHKNKNKMVCHYCGHTEKPVSVCPQCGSLDVMYSGFGTEQVEMEVKKYFPEFTVARLDTDTASAHRKTVEDTLTAFRNGEINILIGTQMVAKGLNFPNVRLVGIVMADSGLLIPDFRAEERTFDLLVQVSGRSGRADSDGHVVVQTSMKDNPAVSYAVNADVEKFLDQELEIRRQTGFPPFSRMINIVFRGKDLKNVKSAAASLAAALRSFESSDFEVFGAQECPIEKIKENYRWQVLVRSSRPAVMMGALRAAMASKSIPHGVFAEVDVDPSDLL